MLLSLYSKLNKRLESGAPTSRMANVSGGHAAMDAEGTNPPPNDTAPPAAPVAPAGRPSNPRGVFERKSRVHDNVSVCSCHDSLSRRTARRVDTQSQALQRAERRHDVQGLVYARPAASIGAVCGSSGEVAGAFSRLWISGHSSSS